MATSTIKAIQTEYAGCLFRSRLEARWAVLFDQLGMTWQYELEGFELPDGGGRYLPDFYLPDMKLWVEVKGANDALHSDLPRLRALASARQEHVLILGEIPPPDRGDVPAHSIILSLAGGQTQEAIAVITGSAWRWSFVPFWALINDEPTVSPQYVVGLHPTEAVNSAYGAARSARFEFGQSGALV